MRVLAELKPVVAQEGETLYRAAKGALRCAIDSGVLKPGEQLPSTKLLSAQMRVSLVTAHRALLELVTAGVLQRAQGRGTFVHPRYLEREKTACDLRVGLVFNRHASVGDYYHGQILEGVRQAAQKSEVDLILLRFGEDTRNECNGFLYVNPLPQDLQTIAKDATRRQPALVVGARCESKRLRHVDVDNVALAKEAVAHLVKLGHRRIAYVGGDDAVCHSRDRWSGFEAACVEAGIEIPPTHVVRVPRLWLDDKQLQAFDRALNDPIRPTAIFAAGYTLALQVYSALMARGLRVPQDLSVIGVDDPVSAAHLWPPLTTMRQPLVKLGRAAMTKLAERIHGKGKPMENQQLHAELVLRQSTAALSH